MTSPQDADRRLFFRGTRAKLDAVIAIFWLLFEIERMYHRRHRRLRIPA